MLIPSIYRAVLAAVALAAASVALVVVTPGQANAAALSQAQFARDYSVIRYGTTVSFAGVVFSDGNKVPRTDGSVLLQRKIVGQTSWTTVSQRALSEDSTPTWSSKPAASAYYRLYYTGSAAASADYSVALKVTVRRNLNDQVRLSTGLYYGKVAPRYTGRTVYIQKSTCSDYRSSSCSWSVYKALRTNRTSNWSVRLPAYARTTHFRAYVKPSSGYAGSLSNKVITTRRG